MFKNLIRKIRKFFHVKTFDELYNEGLDYINHLFLLDVDENSETVVIKDKTGELIINREDFGIYKEGAFLLSKNDIPLSVNNLRRMLILLKEKLNSTEEKLK